MDDISPAFAILAIGTAGVQISIKLIAFARQVNTASYRIQSIGSEVSLTVSVLQQLRDLMNKREDDDISVFSDEAHLVVRTSALACQSAFQALERASNSASEVVRNRRSVQGTKLVLSKLEALQWPFLQPEIAKLHTTLGNARETLMLILHVTTLAYMKKLAEE